MLIPKVASNHITVNHFVIVWSRKKSHAWVVPYVSWHFLQELEKMLEATLVRLECRTKALVGSPNLGEGSSSYQQWAIKTAPITYPIPSQYYGRYNKYHSSMPIMDYSQICHVCSMLYSFLKQIQDACGCLSLPLHPVLAGGPLLPQEEPPWALVASTIRQRFRNGWRNPWAVGWLNLEDHPQTSEIAAKVKPTQLRKWLAARPWVTIGNRRAQQ